MKGIIDKKGALFIERNGEMKPQYCPYNDFDDNCGEHCPLFGAPTLEVGAHPMNGEILRTGFVSLPICHAVLYFDELEITAKEDT